MTAAIAPLFVSVPEAARVMGISKAFAYELVDRGEIPVKQYGRRKLVPVAALERIAAEAAGTAA